MADATDIHLICEYADRRSEAAFAGLVQRHLNLVYSVALRLTGNSADAQDVAQAVFVILGQKAAGLRTRTTLTGWLYETTRFVARQNVRTRHRQQTRDQEAYMQSTLNESDPDGAWQQLAPLLEEGMSRLNEDERTLLALRFFENKNAGETAALLGIQEWAAHKRAHRAVEKLRAFFARRGVVLSAAGLTTAIAANAVQAAPAGLATTISSAVLLGTAAVSTSAIVAATKTIAMTTLQKILIAATVAVLAGTGIYEAHQAAQTRAQVRSLQQQQAALSGQVDQLQHERDAAMTRLAALSVEPHSSSTVSNQDELLKLRGEISVLQNAANDPATLAAQAWMAKVNKLKQRLAETPESKIPELQYLTEQDWLNAARGSLDTDAQYRAALSKLRGSAEGKVAAKLKNALTAYMKVANGQFPTDLSQLQPYFNSPVDDDVLARWEIAPASTIKSLGMGGDSIITQKAPVDDVFDMRYGIGPNGSGTTNFMPDDNYKILKPVYDAYRADHNGQWQSDTSELQPYATTPDQQIALQKMILRQSVLQPWPE